MQRDTTTIWHKDYQDVFTTHPCLRIGSTQRVGAVASELPSPALKIVRFLQLSLNSKNETGNTSILCMYICRYICIYIYIYTYTYVYIPWEETNVEKEELFVACSQHCQCPSGQDLRRKMSDLTTRLRRVLLTDWGCCEEQPLAETAVQADRRCQQFNLVCFVCCVCVLCA